ncbi:STAS domain-containing protein [Derxia lacustris]|uniref:STAS domain-containing protein n=1 Tax=Derxia lacustris TaxID=764842 RepID=UPI000A178640|nr:STAS domain-containing protein [Derxia lacustris]
MNATCLVPSAGHAGSVSHARDGATCVVRLAGDLRHTQGPAFDRFIDGLLADAGIDRVIVDLSEAVGIDSTMLGLLARLALGLDERDGRKPLLVSPRADINTLLDSICLDDCFLRCDAAVAPTGTALAEARAESVGETEAARVILDAHRTLARMNGANRAAFSCVVEALERELRER